MIRMTKARVDEAGNKIDGRKCRRGTRGKYSRKRIHGEDLLERYALLLMAIMAELGIPVYRCKTSNHVYSYRQKIALLVLRKRLKLSYNQFPKDLPSQTGFLKGIGLYDLDRIPDKSTLIKFAKTVDKKDLELIVNAFTRFARDRRVVAIDATGFSNFLRSAHFVKRCKDFGIKKEPRSFTKGSFAVEIKSHLVFSARFSATRKHDTQFIQEHVKDLRGLPLEYALFDKGYDCEPLHKHVRQILKCQTVIPCRISRGNRGFATHGYFRNMMKRMLGEGGELKSVYNQRSQVETANFMIKTHNGSHILSKSDHTREVEGLCMVMSHNCKIVVEQGLWEVTGV